MGTGAICELGHINNATTTCKRRVAVFGVRVGIDAYPCENFGCLRIFRENVMIFSDLKRELTGVPNRFNYYIHTT